nr:MAG TPA: hypothetical protein [Bacteriophage sp.]
MSFPKISACVNKNVPNPIICAIVSITITNGYK